MVWALILTLSIAFIPRAALAVEDETETVQNITEQIDVPKVEPGTVEPQQTLDQKPIIDSLQKLNDSMDSVDKGIGEVNGKLDKINDVDEGLKDVSKEIETVSSKIDGIVSSNAEPAIKPVERLAASSQTFNVYANASPTGSYATYAKQLIPKMDWDDDYVYFQDTSSSYVLVWGDLDYRTAGTFTGTDVKFARWYYSGTSTGYLVQYGSGSVTVNVNNYVVLSSLGEHPLLDDGVTLFRQEVCFYAICACVLFCLRSVTDFLLRYHYS